MSYESVPGAMYRLGFLAPIPTVLPDPPPPVGDVAFSHWELK